MSANAQPRRTIARILDIPQLIRSHFTLENISNQAEHISPCPAPAHVLSKQTPTQSDGPSNGLVHESITDTIRGVTVLVERLAGKFRVPSF